MAPTTLGRRFTPTQSIAALRSLMRILRINETRWGQTLQRATHQRPALLAERNNRTPGDPTVKFRHRELQIAGAKSLMWQDDLLIDPIHARRYGLDSAIHFETVAWGYCFDSVVQSPSGQYAVLYEQRGTKGIVLRDNQLLREINRSYYHAEAYDYPITLFAFPDGREAIVHAPDAYNRLEIDLLETGERLTPRPEGSAEPVDFFHSGLAVDPGGDWLMSAGWVWAPYYAVQFFRIADVLHDPRVLDKAEGLAPSGAEIASAAFLDGRRAVLAVTPDAEAFGDSDDLTVPSHPGTIGIYRPGEMLWDGFVPYGAPTGKMLTVDAEHVLALFEHPKLIHLPSGDIVARWRDIPSGTWDGCIALNARSQPPMAWDPQSKRLAIAAADRIHLLIPD